MELHQLRYALAVAESGSFTAAASDMRVSQSGISTQVQKLERELGLSLFDRSARRITVTAAGERLLPRIRAAVAAVADVGEIASELRGLVVGSLRIGTVTGLAWPTFFDAVAAIHTAHPGVDLRLTESVSDQLIADVRSGALDVAVAAWSPAPPAGLQTALVVDDPLVVAVARVHPWAGRRAISPAELAGGDLIALDRGTGARIALEAMFARAGVSAQPRWEVATPGYMKELTAPNLGVAVASATTLADAPGLVAVPIDDETARSQLGVVWRAGPGPTTRAFLDAVLGEAG